MGHRLTKRKYKEWSKRESEETAYLVERERLGVTVKGRIARSRVCVEREREGEGDGGEMACSTVHTTRLIDINPSS